VSSLAPATSASGACVAHNLANLHNDVTAPASQQLLHTSLPEADAGCPEEVDGLMQA